MGLCSTPPPVPAAAPPHVSPRGLELASGGQEPRGHPQQGLDAFKAANAFRNSGSAAGTRG